MARNKKEKKVARRERQQALKETSARVQERLLLASLGPATEVQYVLADERSDVVKGGPSEAVTVAPKAANPDIVSPAAAPSETMVRAASNGDVAQDDRVKLPATRGAKSAKAASSAAGRKRHKMTWQALKLAVAARYGRDAADLVDEHDGNATNPFFTVQLKMQPYTVPVPSHWNRLRSFLAAQADREEATGIVPAEILALGVDKIRAARDKRANPNQVAFMTCFLTGSPLQRRHFNVHLTRFGEVFYEGRWLPKAHFVPGQLSERLRQALGMTPHAPPPWLYSLQAMRRLPPAYPALRIPGLNAPIPPGAQWGMGQGQWGQSPRGDDNAFLFPGVMDEAAAATQEQMNGAALWGAVPVASDVEASPAQMTSAATPSTSPAPASAKAQPPTAVAVAPRINITPVPFMPQNFVPVSSQARPALTVPQEYVRVQENSVGATVAVGHVMVPKNSTASTAEGAMLASNTSTTNKQSRR